MNTTAIVNKPPKCSRRLFTLTLEADSNLHYVAEHFAMTYSEAVRLGLHLAAERLRDNPPKNMVEAAVLLGGIEKEEGGNG